MATGQTIVGTSAILVVPSNPLRRKFSATNDSSNDIFIGKGYLPSTGYGDKLRPNGTYYDHKDPTGYIYTGEIHAIASGATSTLSWVEE